MVRTPKPINDQLKEVESKINSFEEKYSISEYKDNANQYNLIKMFLIVINIQLHCFKSITSNSNNLKI